jgi:hypothetical protein
MRKEMLLFGLTLAATMIMASADAYSAEPNFLPSAGVTFTGKGPKATLESVGEKGITCQENLVEGQVSGEQTVTVKNINFKKCKAFGFVGVNSLGDVAETVLTGEMTGHLCFTNKAPLEVGLVLKLVNNLHIEEPVIKELLVLRGIVIGELSPVGKKAKEFHVAYAQTKGKQEPVRCEGGAVEDLETSFNGGAFELAGLAVTETLTTNIETEVMG